MLAAAAPVSPEDTGLYLSRQKETVWLDHVIM